MKTLLLIPFYLILIPILVSCQSKENTLDRPSITGKWQLIKIVPTSMIAGKAGTPSTPSYTEIYEFKADSTFRRYRSTGYEATGTYVVELANTNHTIIATFANKELNFHDLPGQKYYPYTNELVYFEHTEPDVLMESYMASDGPSFYYQRIREKEVK